MQKAGDGELLNSRIVHAAETYWTLNSQQADYWVHRDAGFAHFQLDTSRSGQVLSRSG